MRRMLDWFGASLALAAYALGIRRSITLDNLRHAFPERSTDDLHKIARESYKNLGRVFAEMLYLRFAPRENFRRGLEIENLDVLTSSLNSGRGVLLLSGHISNWEWGGIGFNLFTNKSFYLVVKNQTKGFFEEFVQRMRNKFGGTLVPAGDVMTLYRALQRGEAVSMLTDQAAPAESIHVPFFGRNVSTFEGAARLALRTRPIILFYAPRRLRDGRYAVRFEPVEYDDIHGSDEQAIRELTGRHTEMLERAITERPGDWLWQHRRWKHLS